MQTLQNKTNFISNLYIVHITLTYTTYNTRDKNRKEKRKSNMQDYTDSLCHYYVTNHKIYIPKV